MGTASAREMKAMRHTIFRTMGVLAQELRGYCVTTHAHVGGDGLEHLLQELLVAARDPTGLRVSNVSQTLARFLKREAVVILAEQVASTPDATVTDMLTADDVAHGLRTAPALFTKLLTDGPDKLTDQERAAVGKIVLGGPVCPSGGGQSDGG